MVVVMMMVITTCHSFSGAFERLQRVCLPLRCYFHTIFLLLASSQMCAPYALLPLHLYRSAFLSGAHAMFDISVLRSTALPNQCDGNTCWNSTVIFSVASSEGAPHLDDSHLTGNCHTCRGTQYAHTNTHSGYTFPILVLRTCFIRLCCWSDKVWAVKTSHVCRRTKQLQVVDQVMVYSSRRIV